MHSTGASSSASAAAVPFKRDQLIAPFHKYVESVKEQIQEKKDLYRKYNSLYKIELDPSVPNNQDRLTYDELKLPELDVVNIVISSKMNLDTAKIKADPQTEYYPKKFPGYIHRIYIPTKSTLLVFQTGNVICTGTRYINDANRILNNFYNKFKDDTKPNEFKTEVKNLVVQTSFRYVIDVERTIDVLPRCIYEPEQFPGLIYRNMEPKAVVLLFVSGKSICVGCSTLDDAFNTVFQLRKLLLEKDLLILRRK